MREILFKAKRVDGDGWVEGDLIHGVGSKQGKMYILPITHIYPSGCHNLDGWEVDPATVCQFTGLLDKNGRKIFEGDILRRERFIDWVVVHDNGAFKVYNDCNPSMFFYSETFNFDAREIIGNIHDKKEGE